MNRTAISVDYLGTILGSTPRRRRKHGSSSMAMITLSCPFPVDAPDGNGYPPDVSAGTNDDLDRSGFWLPANGGGHLQIDVSRVLDLHREGKCRARTLSSPREAIAYARVHDVVVEFLDQSDDATKSTLGAFDFGRFDRRKPVV
jgi:hypothetical protein